MKRKLKVITVRIDPDLVEAIDRLAEEQRRTRSAQMEVLLRQVLELAGVEKW